MAVLAVLVFAFWFRSVCSFAKERPDIALLEGSEWVSHKRFEARSKSQIPSPEQRKLSPARLVESTVPEAPKHFSKGAVDE
jgi:hypothetical protein